MLRFPISRLPARWSSDAGALKATWGERRPPCNLLLILGPDQSSKNKVPIVPAKTAMMMGPIAK